MTMKPLRLLTFALVFTSALMAEQNVPVAGAPFDVIVPDGWVRIPDTAMAHLRRHILGVQWYYPIGFVGPRPPPNTGVTVLMLRAFETDMTPKSYLDCTRATFAADQADDPGVKMVQDDCQIGLSERAVITSFHASDGRVWRTYAFPSPDALFEFSVLCPATNAPATFAAIESCLSRLRFVAGTTLDAKWIAEMKKSLPASPKRVY